MSFLCRSLDQPAQVRGIANRKKILLSTICLRVKQNLGGYMDTSNHIELEPEHLSAIKALADEIHQPVEDVNKIYAETLERLSSDARIKDYLVVLTCKTVRDELRHSRTAT